MKKWMALIFCGSLTLAGLSTAPLQAQASKQAKTKAPQAKADEKDKPQAESHLDAETLAGLELRSIGPAINSGRIIDFAVTPGQRHRYFAAAASGGVWKTDNGGTTWTPVFDGEGSYSIGTVEIDPHNPNVVWVGTGENNSQRSVSFGDGLYKSLDGGQSWRNMGLEDSGHIGRIEIDPRDSNVVYVAAMGPLWSAGGDRGLYKTTDGGETWNHILDISEDTGVAEVWLDLEDPDTVYATSYQRRRHVWTLLNGGPESGFHKSTDGGETWREIDKGLPSVDRGRMGLCISPVDPNVIYGVVDAVRDEGGFYRSLDRGESWERRSDHVTGGDYWNELTCDPHDLETVYSVGVWLYVTRNGGTSFDRVPDERQHVDHHAVWLDPDDPDYILVGNDGGVYDSHDRGQTWNFKENLPITQFYRVSTDTAKPFYNVFGGTQDNDSMGGPSRTLHRSGISNEDWFITVGGDGYETRVDPLDPNILYAQWQYGGLVRYDRQSEQTVDIQPQEEPGQDADRWNWDSPLILSHHQPTRLYYASQRLYRSDDRGNSWRAVSGDLSRGLDRDKLRVMGRLWGMDAVHKNKSTSDYGNIVSLSESPLDENLLYVGTDDGLIQVTEDGGETWRAIDRVPFVPQNTYVSDLEASLFDANVVYATFDNHKQGDFQPYLAVSRDKGATWSSLRGDLPEREVAYTLIQDHEAPQLLFAGTEFSLWVTLDEGAHWHKLSGGFPTIQVRDLDIQREWNDLVVGTFGRGIYILDDYTPLRSLSEQSLADQEASLFPTRDALRYIEKRDRGMTRGSNFWTADNPPYGASFTYWLRDGLETLRERRMKAEEEARDADKDPPVPSMEGLRQEDLEIEPKVFLVVRDGEADGSKVIRRVEADRTAGLHRVSWDLRYPPAAPTNLNPPTNLPSWVEPERGPLALPGTYSATLEARVDGEWRQLAGPVSFDVVDLELNTLKDEDPRALMDFQRDVRSLRRAIRGSVEVTEEMTARLQHLRQALIDTPEAPAALTTQLEQLQGRLHDIQLQLQGDATKGSRNVFTPPSLLERIERVQGDHWLHTQSPTETHRQGYAWAREGYQQLYSELDQLLRDLEAFEAKVEAVGAPWTPGRPPTPPA